MKNPVNKITSNTPRTSKSCAKNEQHNLQNLKEKEIEILRQFDLNYKYGPCYGLYILFLFI